MYKDVNRIEDALIPALLESIALRHINSAPKDKGAYDLMLGIVRGRIGECFDGLTQEKKNSLYRRLFRIGDKLIKYFVKNKFDTRKMFLVIIELTKALLDENRLIIKEDTKIAELLIDLDTIVQQGGDIVENFDKINRSAINHVLSVYELLTQEGYYR